MKKLLAILALVAVLTTVLSFSAVAAPSKTVNYYDQYGNKITLGGMYYNSQGYPIYNSSCYYLDENGNAVYVGGCRAYYYDANGNLVPGNYCYDANGKAVSRPANCPQGTGCGTYYYDLKGNVVTGTFYYDDFGNPIEAPATTQTYGCHGNGCRR